MSLLIAIHWKVLMKSAFVSVGRVKLFVMMSGLDSSTWSSRRASDSHQTTEGRGLPEYTINSEINHEHGPTIFDVVR